MGNTTRRRDSIPALRARLVALGIRVDETIEDLLVRPTLTANQVARVLGRSRNAVSIAVRKGRLKSTRIAIGDTHFYRIQWPDLMDWAEARPERYGGLPAPKRAEDEADG